MYKKIIILVLLLATVFGQEAFAQSRSKSKSKKKEKQEIPLKEKLWYGGGFGLGYGFSSLNPSINGNLFSVGISPMAGYKLFRFWSAGPRVSYTYLHGRYEYSTDILKLNVHNFGIGAFTRLKFLGVLFSHFEYMSSWEDELIGITPQYTIETKKVRRDQLNLGLGYNAGGILSYEFYILYDVLAPKNSINIPIEYRVGFTFNF